MDLTVVRRSDAGLLLGVEMEFRTGGNGFGRVRRTDEREGEPPFVSFVFVTKKSHRIRWGLVGIWNHWLEKKEKKNINETLSKHSRIKAIWSSGLWTIKPVIIAWRRYEIFISIFSLEIWPQIVHWFLFYWHNWQQIDCVGYSVVVQPYCTSTEISLFFLNLQKQIIERKTFDEKDDFRSCAKKKLQWSQIFVEFISFHRASWWMYPIVMVHSRFSPKYPNENQFIRKSSTHFS